MLVDRLGGLIRSAWQVGIETYESWRDHRTIRLGAGLAYYGLFAFVPLLAVGLSIAGRVISAADVQSYLADQLSALLGVEADTVASALTDALDGTGTLAGLGVVGAVSLILTASLLVLALQDALNMIWERPVRTGIRQTLLRRLVAFLVVAGTGAVIVVSFAINAVTGLLNRVAPDAPAVASFQEGVGLAASWALATGVITLLLRYLTDVRVPWPSALVGGAVTAVIMAVGTVLVGAYLRRYAASSVAGATGGVFLLLLWIYYEAQILLVGAEFTRVMSRRRAARSAGDDGEAGVGPGEDAAVDVDR